MDREMDRGKPCFGKLPCAVQSFEEMRRDGYIYVDKTDLIWDIAHGPKVQFFARPRRFGKSLMISTLKSYFEGRGELFAGLKAEEKRRAAGETEWEKHPTFVFGFSAASFTREDDVYEVASYQLIPYEKAYGLKHEGPIGIRLKAIIHAALEAGGPRPVILVDEYDNPLTDTLSADRQALHLHYKNELRGFYKAIKECAEYLRLVVITGITQFRDITLFSGINQLRNMSFAPEYATLFGLTEEELVETFRPEIERLAERYAVAVEGMDFDGMLGMLRSRYDGYRFTEREVHVYNPQSIIFALDSRTLDSYWAESGTSSLLATVFPTYDYDFSLLRKPIRTTTTDLKQLDTRGEDPVPLLFQSGYLTIIEHDLFTLRVRLDFPNREVHSAFWRVILPLYAGQQARRANLVPFADALEDGTLDEAMLQIEALIGGIPYSTLGQRKERLYEDLVLTALYAWFSALGYSIQTEVHSIRGRADAVVHFPRVIFIFELKVGPMEATAADALNQILEKGYAQPHLASGKRIEAIGISVDTREETRGAMEWAIRTLRE